MDDGSKHGTGLHINVYAFSNSDVDKLMYTLKINLTLNALFIIIGIINLVYTYLKDLWII